jgi:hypothetical protein
MQTASNLSRVVAAAMAALCSLALLATVGQQMNPSRLAATPHVFELERVVVSAPAQTTLVAVARDMATN